MRAIEHVELQIQQVCERNRMVGRELDQFIAADFLVAKCLQERKSTSHLKTATSREEEVKRVDDSDSYQF